MKLLSIHVENYGKLNNVDFDFKNNLTEIFKENGFGKTTVASFIKAMFYGLPSYKINSIVFDDRQRFYPYNNGKFGGNLRFEFNGDVYLIERFFDKKSETKDSLKLYKNDLLVENSLENLGKYFFELDENSFEKTLFFNSDFNEISSSTGINAKLNSFVDGTPLDMDFDSALKKLEKKQKDYKKSRNGESFISKSSDKIKVLSEEIQNLKTKENNLQLKYKERNALRQETDRLSKLQEVYNEQKLIKERYAVLNDYNLQIEKAQKEKSNLLQKYPKGVLSNDDYSLLSSSVKNLENNEFLLENKTFDSLKLSKLDSLNKTFKNSNLNEEKLENTALLLDKYKQLKTEESTLSSIENKRTNDLIEVFEKFPVSDGAFEEVRNKVNLYSKNVSLLENYTTSIPNQSQKNSLPLIFGLLLCLGGIGLAFLNLIVGLIVCFLGFSCLGFSFFIGPKYSSNTTSIILEANKIKSENEILEREIRKFLSPYNIYSEYGVISDFNTFSNLYGDYIKNKATYEINKQNLIKKSLEIKEIEEKLTRFFNGFELNFSFHENFDLLKTNYQLYINYSSDYENHLIQTKRLKSDIEKNKSDIIEILNKYSISINKNHVDTYKEIEKDLKALKTLDEKIESISKQASTYKEKYALDKEIELIEDYGIENLKELQAKLVLLDDEISIEERDVETLIDKENSLEMEKENLKNYTKIYDNLTLTIEKLKQAEDNLRQKYVFPIKEKFEKYAQLIESTLGEKMFMDKNYSIKFERNGEMRSYKHLSLGQLSICSLCLRLSLIDNMFNSNLPFIIMDDPFSDLDKTHFERVKGVVNKLSEKFQIIYLTCHESRKLS